MKGLFAVFLFFLAFCKTYSKDGMECGICEIAMVELDNLESKTPEEIEKTLDKLCELFSNFGKFEKECEDFVGKIVGIIQKFPHIEYTKICELLGFCDKCVLFNYEANETPSNEEKVSRLMAIILGTFSYFFMKDDTVVNKAWVDLDGDGFDELSSDFRGRDCDDNNKNIHPGLKIETNVAIDDNCNGIYGWADQSKKKSYEDIYCNDPMGTENMNLLTFGDSVCVGFSIEEKWLDLNDVTVFIEKALLTLFSFPELSLTTGYLTNHSLYQTVRKRNRCVHRQFENLCVSGGVIKDLEYQVSTAAIPEKKEDMKPALVYIGYVGNDVCKDTLEQMTTPDVFRKYLMSGLKALDKRLPPKSRVMLIGFSNGMQYELMNNATHPLSSPTHKVTYSQFYDFMTCSGINVCSTWLTSDAEKRKKTTERAHELDLVIQGVSKNEKFDNFEMRYIDIDAVIKGGIERMVNAGIPKHMFFNQIDGFHPSLDFGHPYAAIEFAAIMEERFPGFMGKINPYNHDIEKVFGDQGGY